MSASSVNRRRILSLWLPRLPTDRIKRQLLRAGQTSHAAPADDIFKRPWIVAGKFHNALQITALNDAASAIGLEIGQPVANARAICPNLDVFDTDEAADAQALEHIANWCGRFTPLVALDLPHGLFLDISGCAHLFGGETEMLQTVCTSLEQQGFIVNAAIANTPVCARVMTRVSRRLIVADGEEARAVASVPVFALTADESTIRGLRRAGLKTIGDVASRATHEISARFGKTFTGLLQQALGHSDAPISPRKPLPDFMVEKRFPEPIATEDAIASTLSRLAQMLVAAMDKHGKGARRLEAAFFRTDGAVRTITVDAGQPVTRAIVVDRLFRERLEMLADPLDPGFGFDLVRLSASRVALVVQDQRDFDTRSQDNDDVAALIDRIAARIGGSRVVVNLPQDTHIPEHVALAAPAQHYLAAAIKAEWPERYESEPPLRPLRMFERPEEISVTAASIPDGYPPRFVWRRVTHVVSKAEGPERIAMEWWRKERTLTRDYFRVEDADGMRFWIYRDGLYGNELVSGEGEGVAPKWFMHGVFA